MPNTSAGIQVSTQGVTVQANLVSGNSGSGIEVSTGGFGQVLENFVGTDAAGTGHLPNGNYGILVNAGGSSLLWLYLMSHERTGFLRLSRQGRETGFFTVEADFDLLAARITEANGQLYFLVAGEEETVIFHAGLP